MFSHAPQQGAVKAAISVSRHNEEVNIAIFRRLNDDLNRISKLDSCHNVGHDASLL